MRRDVLKRLFDDALAGLKFDQSHDYESPEKTRAQWTAMDCGNALMLIVDYAVLRFLVEARTLLPTKEKGIPRGVLHSELKKHLPQAYGGVTLGEAIATLADLARHFHEFDVRPPFSHNVDVLRALRLDHEGKHGLAAAQFLQNLEKERAKVNLTFTYSDFEDGVIEIAS